MTFLLSRQHSFMKYGNGFLHHYIPLPSIRAKTSAVPWLWQRVTANHGRENHSSGINELSPKQYLPHFIICFIHLSRGLVIENVWREENGCVSLQWRSRYFLYSCLASGAGIWCCCIHGNTTIASSRMNSRRSPTIVKLHSHKTITKPSVDSLVRFIDHQSQREVSL